MMAFDDEPVQDEEDLSTEAGRQEAVSSGSITPEEEGFMEGYENDTADEDEDFGLDDDEKMED